MRKPDVNSNASTKGSSMSRPDSNGLAHPKNEEILAGQSTVEEPPAGQWRLHFGLSRDGRRFRSTVAAQPALLDVRRLHTQRKSHHLEWLPKLISTKPSI